MRSIGILVVAVLALVAVQGVASADGIDLSAGDRIRLYNGTGNGSGGEFDAVVQAWDATSSSYVAATPSVAWSTFCLEADEYFTPGDLLRVTGVTDSALNGGTNTDLGDPISRETAWLYTQFWNGTLTGLNDAGTAASGTYLGDHADNATHLQNAFWYLEGESTGVDNHYVTLATAGAAGWTDIGNVRVMNLQRYSDGQWINAQDQLIMTPVPEPASLALFGLGAGVIALRRRKRKL